MRKPVIMIFIGHYLPGYKVGGPLRSIVNMVTRLHNEFEFRVITSDRDLLDTESYSNVPVEQWCLVGNAHVYYCPPQRCTILNFAKILNDINYDVMYLNSFFSPVFTLKPLVASRLRLIKSKPIVLAPRGEFSMGALKLKKLKKSIYLFCSKLLGLYRDVKWHASSEYEKEDIERVYAVNLNDILIAFNLSVLQQVKQNRNLFLERRDKEDLRIVFLSRISPKKNLDFALKVLATVKENVIFDIYGPGEDQEYLKLCQKLANNIPENVNISFYGSVRPEEVANIFSAYDLFFFPTRGENYGHVIYESLSVGTPVLISDQTPWKNMEVEGLGWDIAFQAGMIQFAEIIKQYSLLSREEKLERRSCIQNTMAKRLNDTENVEANRQLFLKVI